MTMKDPMDKTNRRIERVFRWLYYGTSALVPAVFLFGLVNNLPESLEGILCILSFSFNVDLRIFMSSKG